jgi:PAS domain-containing protein
MELSGGLGYLLFAAISLTSAALALLLTSRIARSSGPSPPGPAARPAPALDARSYEFEGGRLVSPIAAEDAFLETGTDPARASAALADAISDLHPDLPRHLGALFRRGEPFFLVGHFGTDPLAVSGRAEGARIVLTIAPVEEAEGLRLVDRRALDAAAKEAGDLRAAVSLSGAVQWKETGDGRVIWGDPIYLQLAERAAGDGASGIGWPLPRIFEDQLDPHPRSGSLRRCRLAVPDRETPLWFEVAALDLPEGATLFSARPVDRLVKAEATLRDFVQTLTKTFADLPIGLAVFDRNRELVIFNPALVTISTLEPGYLSRRPSLRAFLDQLRERQRMPEPRNYRSWREEIARLEEGAAAGTYRDFWTLPDGSSLRVAGRPHPDGAVALMFEDVSREIGMTRGFRNDLELSSAVLDDTAAAFVVFDRDGRVRRRNAAYDVLVSEMTDGNCGTAEDMTLVESAGIWLRGFAPTGLWGEIRDFASHAKDRAAWSETVTRRDGSDMLVRTAPLRGGHTVVWFLGGGATEDPLAGWLPLNAPARAGLDGAPDLRNGKGEGAA